jgi:hypothetical protein
MNVRQLQAWVLRLVGAVEVFAFGAAVMPRTWMAANHAWLGFGDLPEGPVFESVMRQTSISYGLHGVALWLIATDVVRYRPLVVLTAIGYLLAGPAFLAIDLILGMPWFWIAGNSGSCLLIGTLLASLLAAERQNNRFPRRPGAKQLAQATSAPAGALPDSRS